MSVVRNLPLVLARRQEALAASGQAETGALTARERVALLLDEASFVELDALAEGGKSGVVAGFGLIDGRCVYVYAQDKAVRAGAVGEAQAKKILKVMGLAEKTGAPLVALLDSAGARLDEGMKAVNAYASIARKSALLSGVVPQIAVVLGPCGGGAAACASLSDIIIMSGKGRLFVNGPDLVEAQTGKHTDMEKLAGAAASLESGAAHLIAESEQDALALARKIFSLVPGNNLEDSPCPAGPDDDTERKLPEFNEIDTLADARQLIARVADNGDYVELGATCAPGVVTCLGRVGGETVGFVATQNENGGRLTAAMCDKAAGFVSFLDSFSIPVVTFADTLGAAVDAAPQGAIMRAIARLSAAYSSATSPRVAVITGNAIGTAASALSSRAAADVIYAWPGAVIAPMGVPAAVQLTYEKELHEAKDPDATRAALEKKYADEVADSLNAALSGDVDDVIEPAATRQALAAALLALAGKREAAPARKHGNMPL